MNSNIPYRQDSVCLSEGYVKDPMRFLDYSLIELPINRERYARRGRAEFSKDHEKLDLKFVVGEARLDPTDTLNFKQMNQLKDNMSRYMVPMRASPVRSSTGRPRPKAATPSMPASAANVRNTCATN